MKDEPITFRQIIAIVGCAIVATAAVIFVLLAAINAAMAQTIMTSSGCPIYSESVSVLVLPAGPPNSPPPPPFVTIAGPIEIPPGATTTLFTLAQSREAEALGATRMRVDAVFALYAAASGEALTSVAGLMWRHRYDGPQQVAPPASLLALTFRDDDSQTMLQGVTVPYSADMPMIIYPDGVDPSDGASTVHVTLANDGNGLVRVGYHAVTVTYLAPC